jgi:hypothetical protein
MSKNALEHGEALRSVVSSKVKMNGRLRESWKNRGSIPPATLRKGSTTWTTCHEKIHGPGTAAMWPIFHGEKGQVAICVRLAMWVVKN